uniref:Protein kinase domain-containing protein n=1 Tax=viral metagenome TaxID=1070528 RepID=A0A6C0KVN9_9ZZZZ
MVRKTRKTNPGRGGKYVFSGAYGCTYRPALKCMGQAAAEPGTISKLMSTREAVREYSQKRILEKVDPEFKFMLYPYKMCIPEQISFNNEENNIDTCTINLGRRNKNETKRVKRLSEAQILIYKDGGTDLAHIKPPPEDYAGFFHGFVYLFTGLVKLGEANVIHFDIKPSNLVGLKQENGSYLLRFIDFGLTKRVNDFNGGTRESLYLKNYSYWSFELKLLHVAVLQRTYILNEEHIEDFYNTLMRERAGFPYWNWFTKDGRYRITTGWVSIMIDDIMSGKISIGSLLVSFDLFALGRTLSEIYYRLTGHRSVGPDDVRFKSMNSPNQSKFNEYNVKLKNEISIPFYRLIVKMTNPIFIARPTAREAYEEFQIMLPKIRSIFEEYPAALV